MTVKRKAPYVYATWLAEVMAGERACDFALWFKAHHQDWQQPPNDFDSASWNMKHTMMLRELRREITNDRPNSTVYVEGQNQFWLERNGVTISGKADLVEIRKNTVLIYDAKTGKPKSSHQVQMLLYMSELSKNTMRFGEREVAGVLRYANDGEIIVPMPQDLSTFYASLDSALDMIHDQPPPSPSFAECRFCNIGKEDCPARVESK